MQLVVEPKLIFFMVDADADILENRVANGWYKSDRPIFSLFHFDLFYLIFNT